MPAATSPEARSPSPPASSDELTNVAVAAISGGQLVDLVLHQRDQRREDERRLGPQHRRELVGERLAGAGRHQRERVAALDGGADDLLLAGPEVGEAEELAQAGAEIAHPNECTGRIGTTSCRIRAGRRRALRREPEAATSGSVGALAPPAFSTVTATTAPVRHRLAGSARSPACPSCRTFRPETGVLPVDDPGLVGLAGRCGGEVVDDEHGRAVRGDDEPAGAATPSATRRRVGSASTAAALSCAVSADLRVVEVPVEGDRVDAEADRDGRGDRRDGREHGREPRRRDSSGTTFCFSARASSRIRSRSAGARGRAVGGDRERARDLPERRRAPPGTARSSRDARSNASRSAGSSASSA